MTEPNMILTFLGIAVLGTGFLLFLVFINTKWMRYGFLVMIFGGVLFLHPFWGTWHLFLKNAAMAVPVWVWVVVGATAYFMLNHIYASWLIYAHTHPKSFAAIILGPWPIGLMPKSEDENMKLDPLIKIFGVPIFGGVWIITFLSYTAWLIFGGGIAKLLHLVPRE